MKVFSILALAIAAVAAMDTNAAAPNADTNDVEGGADFAGAQSAPDAAGFRPPPPPAGHNWPRPPTECRPGTYSCTVTNNGWRVCDVSGHWVFGGYCSRNTRCEFNWQNGSPYCLPRRW